MTGRRATSYFVATQLPRWREFREGMTVQQLADRVADLGGDLSRVTITKIENRQRGISLDEALMLAAALNVPPPVLFFPFESGERVAVTPKSVIHPDLAWRWFAGDVPLATTERFAMNAPEWSKAAWSKAATPLLLYRQLRRVQEAARRAESRVLAAEQFGDESDKRKAKRGLSEAAVEVIRVTLDMKDEGLHPPKVPKAWADAAKELGIKEG